MRWQNLNFEKFIRYLASEDYIRGKMLRRLKFNPHVFFKIMNMKSDEFDDVINKSNQDILEKNVVFCIIKMW